MLHPKTEATLHEQVARVSELDRAVLLDDVLELLLSWHTHVLHAEGPAGLHAFLCTTAPRYLSMITHLRSRHREVAYRIENLRAMLARGESTLLAAEYAAILHQIEVHDELETDLLNDALENL